MEIIILFSTKHLRRRLDSKEMDPGKYGTSGFLESYQGS